jgi:hypothetical protein
MHKPTLYSDPATAWLMRQSKAALADMVTEMLRRDSGHCDDPATVEHAQEQFGSLLLAREGLRGLPKRLGSAARGGWLAGGGWRPKE